MCNCDSSCKDFDEGYTQGVESNKDIFLNVVNERDRLEQEVVSLARKLASTDLFLRCAIRIIQAYGEDEGYSPNRVCDEVEALEKAGLL